LRDLDIAVLTLTVTTALLAAGLLGAAVGGRRNADPAARTVAEAPASKPTTPKSSPGFWWARSRGRDVGGDLPSPVAVDDAVSLDACVDVGLCCDSSV